MTHAKDAVPTRDGHFPRIGADDPNIGAVKFETAAPVVAIKPEVKGEHSVALLNVPRGTLNQTPFPRPVSKRPGCVNNSLTAINTVQDSVHGFAFKHPVAFANNGQRNLHPFGSDTNKTLLAGEREAVKHHWHLEDIPVAYTLGEDAQWAEKARKHRPEAMPSRRIAAINYRVIDFNFVAHVFVCFSSVVVAYWRTL
jgi:hypothetical protein